jgi:hypothetical protein
METVCLSKGSLYPRESYGFVVLLDNTKAPWLNCRGLVLGAAIDGFLLENNTANQLNTTTSVNTKEQK